MRSRLPAALKAGGGLLHTGGAECSPYGGAYTQVHPFFAAPCWGAPCPSYASLITLRICVRQTAYCCIAARNLISVPSPANKVLQGPPQSLFVIFETP